METNKNLLIAMQVIKDECIKHSKCEDCPVWEHLDDICEPHYWSIPAPPPEPTERPRIEWLRMLPDDEMLDAVNHIGPHSMFPWHEVVSLEKFRKDVGLDEK